MMIYISKEAVEVYGVDKFFFFFGWFGFVKCFSFLLLWFEVVLFV